MQPALTTQQPSQVHRMFTARPVVSKRCANVDREIRSGMRREDVYSCCCAFSFSSRHSTDRRRKRQFTTSLEQLAEVTCRFIVAHARTGVFLSANKRLYSATVGWGFSTATTTTCFRGEPENS